MFCAASIYSRAQGQRDMNIIRVRCVCVHPSNNVHASSNQAGSILHVYTHRSTLTSLQIRAVTWQTKLGPLDEPESNGSSRYKMIGHRQDTPQYATYSQTGWSIGGFGLVGAKSAQSAVNRLSSLNCSRPSRRRLLQIIRGRWLPCGTRVSRAAVNHLATLATVRGASNICFPFYLLTPSVSKYKMF
jgi:hypothetical protein